MSAVVDEALKAAIGPVEFVFSIEEEFNTSTRAYRLHLHGELGLGGSKRRLLVKACAALRRALGAWQGEAMKRQIRFRHDVDCGWASYMTKRAWLATPRMRAFMSKHRVGRAWTLSFSGKVLTMTNGIRDLAQEMHEEARQIVLEARQDSPAPVEALTPPAPAEPASAAPEASEEHQARFGTPDAPVSGKTRPAGALSGWGPGAPASTEPTLGPSARATQLPGLAEEGVSARRLGIAPAASRRSRGPPSRRGPSPSVLLIDGLHRDSRVSCPSDLSTIRSDELHLDQKVRAGAFPRREASARQRRQSSGRTAADWS